MSSVRIECVAQEGYRIGESPVWDEKEGALLYVDITGRKVCRWSPLTRQVQAIPVGKEPLENPPVCGSSVLGLGLCPSAVARCSDLETFPYSLGFFRHQRTGRHWIQTRPSPGDFPCDFLLLGYV